MSIAKPVGFPDVMPEADMKKLCAAADDPYPEVEDREEIEDGDFIIITLSLEHSGFDSGESPTKEDWALAAQVNIEGGTKIATLCENTLWAEGWINPGDIIINPDIRIRSMRPTTQTMSL